MSEAGGIITTDVLKIAPRQFWHWWRRRLSEALPAFLLRLWRGRGADNYPEIEVVQGPGGVSVETIGSIAPDSDEVLIRLPIDAVLFRVARYPFQVADAIPDLLAAEVDRFTPFEVDEVMLDHRIISYDWSNREIAVLVAAIGRNALTRSFAAARASGHVPVGAVVSKDDQTLRFADPDAITIHGARARRPDWLKMAVIVAGLVVLALPTIMIERHKVRLSDRLSQVRTSAQSSAGAIELARNAEAKRVFVTQILGQTVQPMELLSELSSVMPRDSWVTSFTLQGSRITIQGNSASASTVLTALAGSSLFGNVEYRSSITRDPRTGTERFEITAVVVPGAEGRGR